MCSSKSFQPCKVWPFLSCSTSCYQCRLLNICYTNPLAALVTVSRTQSSCPYQAPSVLLVTAITSTRCCLEPPGAKAGLDLGFLNVGCRVGRGEESVIFPTGDHTVLHGYGGGFTSALPYGSSTYPHPHHALMKGRVYFPVLSLVP